jgi:hypothetical protein
MRVLCKTLALTILLRFLVRLSALLPTDVNEQINTSECAEGIIYSCSLTLSCIFVIGLLVHIYKDFVAKGTSVNEHYICYVCSTIFSSSPINRSD